MKQPVNDSDIIEQIITWLGLPLRRKEAEEAIKASIDMLRWWIRLEEKPRPATNVAATKKLAQTLLGELELEPIGNLGCDRDFVTLDEFKSALEFFANIRPLPKVNVLKYVTAENAYELVNRFAQEPPTSTFGKPVREIASLLYESVSGKKIDMKLHVERVCSGWLLELENSLV